MGDRVDPYVNFRFQVEVDGVIAGGFAEVTGLDVELRTESFREGGLNTHVHHLPAAAAYPPLVLRRGLTDSDLLWSWCKGAAEGRPVRKRASVIVLAEDGTEKWRWNFRGALPVRWSGPVLAAAGRGVAMETLELVHEGFERG